MDDPINILTLLGFTCENISNVSVTADNDSAIIRVEEKDKRPFCPYCHSTEVGIKGYYVRRINNSIVKHHNLTIELRQRRYICHRCKKTFNAKVDFVGKGENISFATKQSIIDDLKERRTITAIANEHNVSPTTVVNIFDKIVFNEMNVHLPPALCIDEFHFINRKALGKFPAVISDYFNGNIIDIIKSRRKEYLFEYFNKVKVTERYKVKYFISDMNESYRNLKKAFFRDATHIIDMFHITKLFTEAITRVRVHIMKEYDSNTKEYHYLKKNWKLFLMHQDRLSNEKKIDKYTGVITTLADEVNHVLKMYPVLNYCYQTYEEFYFKTRKPLLYKNAETLVEFLIQDTLKSNIIELENVGRSLSNWKYEIINTLSVSSFGFRLSNAVAEANNNNIQTLIDSSYGLLNFDRTRKRILYIAAHNKTRKQ